MCHNSSLILPLSRHEQSTARSPCAAVLPEVAAPDVGEGCFRENTSHHFPSEENAGWKT